MPLSPDEGDVFSFAVVEGVVHPRSSVEVEVGFHPSSGQAARHGNAVFTQPFTFESIEHGATAQLLLRGELAVSPDSTRGVDPRGVHFDGANVCAVSFLFSFCFLFVFLFVGCLWSRKKLSLLPCFPLGSGTPPSVRSVE